MEPLFVSFVGFVALLGGVSVLARRYPRKQPATPAAEMPILTGGTRQRLMLAGGAGMLVLLPLSVFHPEASAATLEPEVMSRPPTMTTWRLEPALVPARFVSDETGKRLFANVFVNDAGERVEYYAGILPYRMPDVPLDYRDVLILDALPELVTIQTPVGSVEVNRMTTLRDERRSDVLFWYELDGRVTHYLPTAKAYTAWQLITGGKVLPTLVVAALDIRNTGDKADVLPSFAAELLASGAR
jgi:hypothetical protein